VNFGILGNPHELVKVIHLCKVIGVGQTYMTIEFGIWINPTT